MQQGSANDKQTKLNFAPKKSHADNDTNPQPSTNGSKSNYFNTNEGNRPKRNRIEFEQPITDDNIHLQVPGYDARTSGSDSSLFSSDSISTIIDRNDLTERANNADLTGPREDLNNNNNRYTEDEHKQRVIKLERLRDKADRYSSHIGFLKECRETKVIPKGLKIDVEPSIGNQDEQFCSKWFARLEEFSITLISDIIEYSESIENDTAAKITEETDFLKRNMNPNDFKEVEEIMNTNGIQRRKRLSITKRKKYHYLRYNRPERRDSSRPERQDDRHYLLSNRNREYRHSDEDYPSSRSNRANRDDTRGNDFGDHRPNQDKRNRSDHRRRDTTQDLATTTA